METPTLIPIDKIDPNPWQPREAEDPEVVAELAADIKRNTLLQIPIARRVDGRVQIAFGHTRLAAFKLNQEPCMPLIIRELDDLQMFEMGNAENIRRRDLNPIEKARAMEQYMREFGKTSVEAGTFFGMSEEAVRGNVRLLNLAPEAQRSLKEGKITITTARSILSMQKIAAPEVIAKTVQKLEKGTNDYDHQETPDEIIEHSLQRLDETVRMWTDNRDGKPRSHMGYNEPGWLLSNKSFPNKLLPYLKGEDLAVALGVQNDEGVLEKISQAFAGWSAKTDWEQLIYPDLKQRLADRPDLLAKVEHLANPPQACSTCPFYTRINGSHYCGMKTCHTRKTVAWHAHILQQAVNNLRIPLYTKTDGKYQILTYEHEKLFEARNKDLRIIPRVDVRGYHYQHFKGVEDTVFLVVMTGKTLENKKEAVKEARAAVRQTVTPSIRRAGLVEEHKKLLEWEASLPVKSLFDAFNETSLKALDGVNYGADEDDAPEGAKPAENASEELKLDFQRRLFALSILREAEGRYTQRDNTCEAWALWLCDTLVSWGLKPPKGFVKAAQRFDQEIEEAVSVETPKKGKR